MWVHDGQEVTGFAQDEAGVDLDLADGTRRIYRLRPEGMAALSVPEPT